MNENIKITQVEIDLLKPADYNPRKWPEKAIADLKASIAAFGLIDPIIVNSAQNRANIVIGGHFRLHVAKMLGFKTVPVVYIGIPDLKKEKELNIRLNKNLGEWDFDLLAGFDTDLLSDIGFDSTELDKIFKLDASGDDDAVPEAPAVPRAKLGDIYKLGEHRVMCGDSTNSEDVEKLMGGGRPILMVTDPPYGVNYDPEWRNGIDNAKQIKTWKIKTGKVCNDDRVDWSAAYLLFPGDVMYVWHSGIYAKDFQDSIEKSGFNIVAQIIWNKNSLVLSRGDYHWKHEPCWYAVRKGKKHNWQGLRNQSTVWDITMACGFVKEESQEVTNHSTQKPVECMSRPILNNSKRGDGVYDPFIGSGSTLIAAQKTERVCFGMELNPIYVDMTINRWEKSTGQKVVKL